MSLNGLAQNIPNAHAVIFDLCRECLAQSSVAFGMTILSAAVGLVGPTASIAQDLYAPVSSIPAYRVAPGYSVQQWGIQDGLPVGSVTSVHQDDKGYIWLATLHGLVRFDGSEFRVFDASQHAELPSNRIRWVTQGDGFMILFTETDVAVYFDGERFVNLTSAYDVRPRRGSEDRVIDGTVYVIGQERVWAVRAGLVVERVRMSDETDLLGLTSGNSPNLLAWSHYIGRVDSFGVITRFDLSDIVGTDPVGRDAVTAVTRLGSGDLIASTSKGVLLLRKGGHQFVDGGLRAVEAYNAVRDDEALFLRGINGWYRLTNTPLGESILEDVQVGSRPVDLSPGMVIPVGQVDGNGVAWLPTAHVVQRRGIGVFETEHVITRLAVDRDNGIWVSTLRGGVYRIVRNRVDVEGILPEGGQNAYGLLGTPDGIWVGLLDLPGFVLFRNDKPVRKVSNSIPWVAGRDADGSVWLGGSNLCRVTRENCEEMETPSTSIRLIYQDSSGRFWIGGDDGLWYRNPPDLEWRELTIGRSESPWVRAATELQDGTVLFATAGHGVLILASDTLRAWDRSGGFPSDNVRSFHESGDLLLIGTEDVGLVALRRVAGLDVDSWEVTHIRKEHGLPDNAVHAIIEDEEGRLWFSSNQGVYTVALVDLERFLANELTRLPVLVLDERDGMLNREGNGGFHSAGYQDDQGVIRFPTQAGVVAIDPPRAAVAASARVFPEQVVVDGVGLPVHPDSTLSIAPGARNISFRYSAPWYYKPEALRFRYRLSGYSEDWVDAETQRQITLTAVPPGDYTLEIEAGIGGAWTGAPSSVHFTQRPWFWQTWWFGLLVAGMIGALLVGLYRYRTNRIRRRNAELERTIYERTEQLNHQMERLATLDDMKSRFFTNVSHELRTPLTLIHGSVGELLESEARLPSNVTERVRRIKKGSSRLLRLVNQILDLAAVDASALQLVPSRTELVAFVRRIVQDYAQAARDRDINVEACLPEDPVVADVDRDKLEFVITNLLSNALKYSPPGARVDVRLDVEPDQVLIQVSDTGRGIAPDDLPRIFDRFYQGSDTSSGGSGIGLSVVRELTRLHGGDVDVRSELGTGSTFIVTLPKCQPGFGVPSEQEAKEPAEAAAVVPRDSHAREASILVVEDDPDVRQYVQSMLENRYEVQVATNGVNGLELATEHIPDLVISDLMMPEMDGHALCKSLKSNTATSHIPVIMLTAKADALVETLEQGADVYLSKPFDGRELHAYISSLLANRQRIRDALRRDPVLRMDHPELASPDVEFLGRIGTLIEENLSDSGFGIDQLAGEVGLSTRQLLRKVEAVAGLRPGDVLRGARLNRAAALLDAGRSTAQAAAAVGYRSESSFRRAFRQKFGVRPSEYARAGRA